MKRYILVALVCLALVIVISIQFKSIKSIKLDRDRYKSDTETLLSDIGRYKTKDSLNAISTGVLQLRLSEFEKYRADDAALIKSLETKNRDLQNITTAQLQTINELHGSMRDSVVYLPGDTVVLQCLDISDKWFELHGCLNEGQFNGQFISRDSLLIAATVQYKRFLGFLWKTRKVKNRQVDAVSQNPHTNILSVEYVEIIK